MLVIIHSQELLCASAILYSQQQNAHKSGISQHFQPQRQYLAMSEATEPTGAAEEATESTLIAVDDEVGTHH